MSEPAELAQLPQYPAVAGTCLIALGIYALADPTMLDPVSLDLRAFWAEPWRLVTSTLVHGGQLSSERRFDGLIHVGFNCYWMWRLGTPVERRFGHLATLGLFVLFGVAGGMLEYAFAWSSVGLSGVVYGLAAMLWVLGRPRPGRGPAWPGAIDDRTVKFFAGWFVFCIVATALEVMNIANFAHAGGALIGGLVGWAIAERGARRGLAIGLSALTLGVFAAGASVLRPVVNLSKWAGIDAMALAERAAADEDLEQAVAWAERGVGFRRTPADHWAYLGRLYFELGRYDEACDALAEGLARDPDNEVYAAALEQARALAGP